MDAIAMREDLTINPVIYAELSLAFARIEELEAFVASAEFRLSGTPREALFLAGNAFLAYRKQGGTRTGVLPNFFIGSHAAVMDLPLPTQDAGRYRTYFPGIQLIAP